jgi:UDPglucose 6-dehydrogenase
MIRITMVGTGYVGLVSGACMAEIGHRVTCTDCDTDKIERLSRGEMPFHEPGLAALIEANRARGRLSFDHEPARAVAGAQVVFLTVGTPPGPDGAADLTALHAASRLAIEQARRHDQVLVQKSTAPVGTARRLLREIPERNGFGPHLDVAVNPEFLRERAAIEDFLHPDRIVIGVETPRAERLLEAIYRPLTSRGVSLLVTNLESAEMIKYASNCFLATKISYIDEIADLCETVGADVRVVSRGMGMDQRIGPKFLSPGPGFGGSCFPKDAHALVRFAAEQGEHLRIAEAALDVNEAQRERMVRKAEEAMGGLKSRRIALLGLAFKPDTDDVRESPGLDLAGRLVERGATIVAHDPQAIENARATPVGQQLVYASGPYEAIEGADAVMIVTEWEAYRRLDLRRVATLLRDPVLLDLRGVFDPERAVNAGLDYHGVGVRARLGAVRAVEANGNGRSRLQSGLSRLAAAAIPAFTRNGTH